MKRPQGFDGPAKDSPDARRSAKPAKAPRRSTIARGAKSSTAPAKPTAPTTSSRARATPAAPTPPQRAGQDAPARKGRASDSASRRTARDERASDRATRRAARKASRERRRYEKQEVRRFTRRTRHRKAAWLSVAGVTAALAGLLAVAVYSPLLALTSIEVTGTSRVDADAVRAAAEPQVGTPLALLDHDDLRDALAAFPLIRSYTTQIVPPGTLVIAVVERAPVGVIQTATGFSVVDAAGIVLEHAASRPSALPLIATDASGADSDGFRASVEVLLAMPDSLRSAIDSVGATTRDDVRVVLAAGGQAVVWGSAERSELKARVLERLLAAQPGAREYDVSAPLSPVVRQR